MSTQTYPSSRTANYALGVLLLAYIFSFVDRQILNLLVDPIKRDLGISDFQMSFLQGFAFAIFYTVLGIPISRLADRSNRKRLITAGLALWSLMTCFCGLARSYGFLFAARVGVGVGEAALSPAAYSMMSDLFPKAKLGRATAVFSLGISIGGGLAYLIGGTVASWAKAGEVIALPVFGDLQAWQLAFIVVGLPGLLLSLLMMTIKEPPRQDLAANTEHLSVGETIAWLWQRRGIYLRLILAMALFSVLGYGALTWYPACLMRTFGKTIAEVGQQFGLVYLCCGLVSTLSMAKLSEWLFARGHHDANLKLVFASALLALIPVIAAPLMPTYELALAFMGLSILAIAGHFGVGIAALQMITPNRLRAQISAVLLLCTNLLGLGLGPTLVAASTDFIFGYDGAVRYSLALVSAIVTPLTIWLLWKTLPVYRRALNDVELS
jgi:MFS family permease